MQFLPNQQPLVNFISLSAQFEFKNYFKSGPQAVDIFV